MSNKLTREVIYLKESDRPKKVEPLSFTEWVKTITLSRIHEMNYSELNHHATCYSTYLQEFSAEEVGVEFDAYYDKSGICIATCKPSMYESVTYSGKCDLRGDSFYVKYNGAISIYFGKLNSGLY